MIDALQIPIDRCGSPCRSVPVGGRSRRRPVLPLGLQPPVTYPARLPLTAFVVTFVCWRERVITRWPQRLPLMRHPFGGKVSTQLSGQPCG